MEAGGDEEVADGQNIQSSNANVGSADSRDARSNCKCDFYNLSFPIASYLFDRFLDTIYHQPHLIFCRLEIVIIRKNKTKQLNSKYLISCFSH